jgi:Domain of unknown function (DUF4342)
MSDFKVIYEEFKIQGKDLVEKLKGLVHEGNIRRIIIKDKAVTPFWKFLSLWPPWEL